MLSQNIPKLHQKIFCTLQNQDLSQSMSSWKSSINFALSIVSLWQLGIHLNILTIFFDAFCEIKISGHFCRFHCERLAFWQVQVSGSSCVAHPRDFYGGFSNLERLCDNKKRIFAKQKWGPTLKTFLSFGPNKHLWSYHLIGQLIVPSQSSFFVSSSSDHEADNHPIFHRIWNILVQRFLCLWDWSSYDC